MLCLTSQLYNVVKWEKNLRSETIHASHGFLPVVPRPADEIVPAPLFVCSAVDLDITGLFDDDVYS